MSEYNGWTNYETWRVKLWLDNEQSTYNWMREITEVIWHDAEATKYGWSRETTARVELGQRLKMSLEDDMPELPASMWSDLLNSAFSEVNWQEIAESLITDHVAELADA